MNDEFRVELGFDTFTGRKLPDEVHLELRCPMPNHDIWRLYGHNWLKVR